MRICLCCGSQLRSAGWDCPTCGRTVEIRQGTPVFAPSLADANDGYDPSHYATLAALEAGNFWFKWRNRLIQWALDRFLPDATSLFEVGCGTGFVLQGIAASRPSMALGGSDLCVEGLAWAAQRLGPQVALAQMDARHIPFRDEFDVIGAFDVLEHIDEDGAAIAEMARAIRPGGGLILSVPQHPWLWSAADVAACHKRRYRRGELEAKVRAAGLNVVWSGSFMALPLPLLGLARLQLKRTYDPIKELDPGVLANTMLDAVLAVEHAATRLGIRWPVGGSRLVVTRKSSP